MQLFFIRHGKTDWGRDKRISGWSDPPLNAVGIDESEARLAEIKDAGHDVIYASTLKRASQTAEIIQRHLRVPLILTDDLRERNFGSLEGKTWEQVKVELGPDIREKDRRQEFDYRKFGGESAADVRARLERFLDHARASGYRKPLVVSHSGVIRMLSVMRHDSTVGDVEHDSVYPIEV